MNTVATTQDKSTMLEQVLVKGDLSSLSTEQRSSYYMKVCESVGLNPLTKPFEYITLNGKLTLYALRACTDQLRSIHKVSVEELTETEREGVFVVTTKVKNAEGRTDMAKGAVNIAGLKGEALANALMKAETKAKRRATLSICGLGMLDETEVETIPGVMVDATTGEIKKPSPFKTAIARKQYCENCFASFDNAQTLEELTEIINLNKPKFAEMEASGNEHDGLALEEMRKRYQIVMNRLLIATRETPEDEIPPFIRDMDEQFNAAVR